MFRLEHPFWLIALILVPLLPGDPLYDHPDNAIFNPGGQIVGYKNYILVSRTNTVHVDVDEASTDRLVQALGLTEDRYVAGDPGVTAGRVVGVAPIQADIILGGVLILNRIAINIEPGATTADVVAAINAQSKPTGITASLDAQGRLVLDYQVNESVNLTSPFVERGWGWGATRLPETPNDDQARHSCRSGTAVRRLSGRRGRPGGHRHPATRRSCY